MTDQKFDSSMLRDGVIFSNKWFLQVPMFLIMLEISLFCLLRIIHSWIRIKRYKHKAAAECCRPPVVDVSRYFSGAPPNSSNSKKKLTEVTTSQQEKTAIKDETPVVSAPNA
ncbi:Lysine histidine transporter-like 4 [Aphelenchoides bicaudatus]|nr:Lysine histidine transporter-like 4 [Aphelenchoides bicaudatus]